MRSQWMRPAVKPSGCTGSMKARAAICGPHHITAASRTGPMARATTSILLISPGYQAGRAQCEDRPPIPGLARTASSILHRDSTARWSKPGIIGASSPAIVVSDTGSWARRLLRVLRRSSQANVPGYIRGFDVRTGKKLWTFHTIAQPGEVRQRNLGQRFVEIHRQYRCVGAAQRGRTTRLRLSPRRNAHGRFLRRHAHRK